MAQQTAVEWFINEIESKGDASENASIRRLQISIDISDYLELKRQAKQMEKEQIMRAYDKVSMSTPEQYYNQTYEK
jgi:hypothetical protein